MIGHKVISAVFAGALLLGALPVAAQSQEADKLVYKKKTVIDFSDVTIEGELTKPEGSYLVNRKKTKFKNLIQVRGDFKDELQKSMHHL